MVPPFLILMRYFLLHSFLLLSFQVVNAKQIVFNNLVSDRVEGHIFFSLIIDTSKARITLKTGEGNEIGSININYYFIGEKNVILFEKKPEKSPISDGSMWRYYFDSDPKCLFGNDGIRLDIIDYEGEDLYLPLKASNKISFSQNMTLLKKEIKENFPAIDLKSTKNSSRNNSSENKRKQIAKETEIELPLKLEAGPHLRMKLKDASEGYYAAVVPHEDWKGKATDYVVTVSTQTGKNLDDTSLEEFTLEKEGVYEDPSWVSVQHDSSRVLVLRVSPLYSSKTRYARLLFKVNGKDAGELLLIQLAQGDKIGL